MAVDVPVTRHLAGPVEHGKAPGLFAAVIDRKGVRAIATAGIRKLGSPEKLTVNDQVHLGSLTKAMTSVMLETLVADGTLPNGWKTTVAEVFPELLEETQPHYQSVNLFQLVRMKSGIGHYRDLKYNWKDRLAGYFGNPSIDIVEERYAMVREILASSPVGPVGKFKYSSPGLCGGGSNGRKAHRKELGEVDGGAASHYPRDNHGGVRRTRYAWRDGSAMGTSS